MKVFINSKVALFAIFVVAIISLSGPAEGTFCKYRDLGPFSRNGRYYLFCIQTTDYIKVLDAARTNLKALVFTNSEIPVLKNASFVRIGENIDYINLHKVGLEEIEDDAFQGLNNLQKLFITGNNKLEIVKGVWFRDLNKLTMIKLQWNRIKTIEGSFFSNLGYVKELYLSGNDLTCLPNAEFEQFHVTEIAINYNPWDEQCLAWIKNVLPRENVSATDSTDLRPMIGELATNLPDIAINSTDDLCRFVGNHPSPVIHCKD